ncbi:hypothetical protein BOTBODRAFT_117881 [Botryobasidium botryosum FD-172 SS1]|uniref:CMP/dCMP-type deaminase domain-containing protein n=1 Tax=Botryobasidium botryosum (strain FD-172 SS1) TaxID=930990 RepID=A0A067MBI0_BOTB1|nr:hypothetical protein BOTBODRAFT_117881 [Botryobasidium botryosum FD-172 SS1]
MCKSDWLYQRCADAAEKSPMQFTLGAVLVKGGKVISTGYNHQRTRYDGRDTSNRTPISMHAEMHAIYNACGSLSPAFSQQVQSGSGGGQRHDRAKKGERGRGPSFNSSSVGANASRSDRGSPSPEPSRTSPSPEPVRARGEVFSKAYDARRRDPRVNGSDLYVARITKLGVGGARPCGRCLEWCKWAGVKRVFHWNGDEGKFEVVKVNGGDQDVYQTHADIRLVLGTVSPHPESYCDCLELNHSFLGLPQFQMR